MNPKQAIKDHYIKAFIDSGMSEEEAEAKWNELKPQPDTSLEPNLPLF